MAVTDQTYAGLQNSIIDWMVRPDLTATQVKDAIALFEAEINSRIYVREMETATPLTTVNGEATIPADFICWRSLTHEGQISSQVEYAHPTVLRAAFPTLAGDIPAWFTIEDNKLVTRPIDDGPNAYTLRYYQKIPSLSDAAPSNWLLLKRPDIYLSGSLYNAYKFVRDQDAASAYKQIMEEAIGEMAGSNERNKAPVEPRIMGVVV